MTNSSLKTPIRRKTLWNKVIMYGITKDMSFPSLKKVRIINVISLWILLINLITSIRWVLLSTPSYIVVNIIAVIVYFTVLYLNKKHLHRYARILFLVYIPIHICYTEILTSLGFEHFLFPMMIVGGFLIDRSKIRLLYLLALSVAYIVIQADWIVLNTLVYDPLYTKVIYSISALLSTVFSILAINLFTKEYEYNRSEILIKNKMLKESVRITIEKADYTAFLFREMNHRVKNNLQIISSLLNIHSEKLTDVAAKEAMTDARNRVYSIAILHKQLYINDNLSDIDISSYVDNLINHFIDIIPSDKKHFDLQFESDRFLLHVEDAVSVGLIINELLTNAINHSANNTKGEFIKLKIVNKGNGRMEIIREDNFDVLNLKVFEDHKGFGFELIETLYKKYNGSLKLKKNENKLIISLIFSERVNN